MLEIIRLIHGKNLLNEKNYLDKLGYYIDTNNDNGCSCVSFKTPPSYFYYLSPLPEIGLSFVEFIVSDVKRQHDCSLCPGIV